MTQAPQDPTSSLSTNMQLENRGGRSGRNITPERARFSGVWWRHALAVLALVYALFPILFIVSSAFNDTGTLSSSSLIPSNPGVQNFVDLFNDPARPFWTWFRNSMIICIFATAFTVFLGACAAFAFSRLRWQGRRAGLLIVLLAQMFPALLAFVALYITFANIGEIIPQLGLNTLAGLTLVYLGGAMGSNIWLLKGYFDTVPTSLDEAAMLDGASHARIFFTVILRLVSPILATVAILAFVGLWGEFLLASIFLTDVSEQTLAVGLYATREADRNALFGQFVAGALIASIPVVLVYLALQKQLVGGLTSGSVK
ncbi:MAG: sugar ABC transporter permease [Ornithinimicrobium sp.]